MNCDAPLWLASHRRKRRTDRFYYQVQIDCIVEILRWYGQKGRCYPSRVRYLVFVLFLAREVATVCNDRMYARRPISRSIIREASWIFSCGWNEETLVSVRDLRSLVSMWTGYFSEKKFHLWTFPTRKNLDACLEFSDLQTSHNLCNELITEALRYNNTSYINKTLLVDR